MSRLQNINSAHAALNQVLDPTTAELVYENYKKNVTLESNKTDDFLWLTDNGVVMPDSQPWVSPRDLLDLIVEHRPCVVKQNTPVTIGIQTTVVKHTHDIAEVVKSIQYTGGKSGLVQRFVNGWEFTATVLVGARNWQLIGTARDYKKQFNNNTGLNTFGLGSCNLVNYHHPNLTNQLDVVVGCYQTKYQYRGFLSCQFIVDQHQNLWLMECNTRICDPEFQSMLPNLPLNFDSCVQQALSESWIDNIELDNKNAVTVVLVHSDWPVPQSSRFPLKLDDCPFNIHYNHGTWDKNLYHASITNQGLDSQEILVDEIYNYLQTKSIDPYRYRTDIAKTTL